MRLIALLLVLLFTSPAYAMNELQGLPLSKLQDMTKAHGVVIEKLSDADTAMMDAATNPRPKPSMIYLLSLPTSVIIALVRDDVVIFSSDPIEAEKINKMLNRTGA